MASNNRIPDERYLRVAQTLYANLLRSRLQDALATSKLLVKGQERTRARRICSEARSWNAFLMSSLADESSHEATLRLLGALVATYVNQLDSASQSAYHRALRAAEKGDAQKIISDVDKLKRAVTGEGKPCMEDPLTCLYLGSTFPLARARIVQMVSAGKGPIPPIFGSIAQIKPPAALPVEYEQPMANAGQLLPAESPGIPMIADTGRTGLVDMLRRLAQEPCQRDWNLEQLRPDINRPPDHVEWPDLSFASPLMMNMRDSAARLLQVPAGPVEVASLPNAIDYLKLFMALGEECKSVISQLRTAQESARQAILQVLASIPSSFSGEAASIRTKLDRELWEDGVRELAGLVDKSQSAWRLQVDQVLTLAQSLEAGASFLPDAVSVHLGERVRSAVLDLDAKGLEELQQKHKPEWERAADIAGRRKAASLCALSLIEAQGQALPAFVTNYCMTLVENGDENGVRVFLEHFNSATPGSIESAAVPTTAASAPAGAAGTPEYESDEIRAELTTYKPRNWRTAAGAIPSDATSLMRYLYERAVEELRSGSVVGVLDHALDMLKILGSASGSTKSWAQTALALLASPPPTPSAPDQWGPALADRVTTLKLRQNEGALATVIARLLSTAGFDDAIAERFVIPEVVPFSRLLADQFYSAATAARVPVLEDVARAIGHGVRYGDMEAGKTLLVELTRSAGANAETVAQVEQHLDSLQSPYAMKDSTIVGLEWLEAGGIAFADGYRVVKSFQNRDVRDLEVRVPASVIKSGGFALRPDADVLDVALLVTNATTAPCSIAEIQVPSSSNPWLSADTSRCLGPMPPKSRTLVPLRLPLNSDLPNPGTIALQYRILYREVGRHETRLITSQISLSVRSPGEVDIADFRGADSQPIVLVGEAFDRSPKSVRDALLNVRRALSGTGAAAMVIGRRRRGKTSFLTTLYRDEAVRLRYCCIRDTIERQPFESYLAAVTHLGEVLDRATRQLNVDVHPHLRDLLSFPNAGWSQVQDWLGSVSAVLPRQVHVLLLLDEFQKWLSRLQPEARANLLLIFRGLRNRPSDEKLSISVILAGLSNLRDYTEASLDFKAAFDVYDLRPFNSAETEALIRSNATIEFDRRAVGRIRHLSGGNPFLINLLGNDIAEVLRHAGRTYCLPEDVEAAVTRHLELGEDSRVWRYLEYLLRQDEEDTGARIAEFPALLALSRTVNSRAFLRTHVSLDEIVGELESSGVECDRRTLTEQLKTAERNELVDRKGMRYSVVSGWLSEWLAKRPAVPVKPIDDSDLVLNRYKIQGHRRGGGQAAVYEAVDTMLTDRRVVLKIYAAVEGRARSFEREAKALCCIRHENVVKCLNYGFDERRGGVLVLDPVDGETLANLFENHSATAESLIGIRGDLNLQVGFLQSLAEALHACHSAGVIHKDLSPSNIIVYSKDGLWHPVLIDFGIASRTDEVRNFATTGAYTPGYVAPERHAGHPRREPADIYCLGVIGYELLIGKNPFPVDPVAAAEMQRNYDFDAIANNRPDLPQPLAELIELMMMVEAADRPDALTVAKALPASLQPIAWNERLEAAREAYTAGASTRAYELFELAVVSAPESEMHTDDYLGALEDFVVVAKNQGKLFEIGSTFIDRLCRAASQNDSAHSASVAKLFFAELTQATTPDPELRASVGAIIRKLADIVWNNGAISAIGPPLGVLLDSVQKPAFWDRRHELFFIAQEYLKNASLLPEVVSHWCVRCSRLSREQAATPSEPQLWLQRAQKLGAANTGDYLAEKKALENILPTADSARLPDSAPKQDPPSDILGSDEQGHFQGERMTRWASRLLRAYPWVTTVRRLKADASLDKFPTRLLDLGELARHTRAFPSIDPNRIIPAVLDASFAKPANSRVVRINIVLSERTTSAQREAAMTCLREDRFLFPEG